MRIATLKNLPSEQSKAVSTCANFVDDEVN